jgi:hypothetical protein
VNPDPDLIRIQGFHNQKLKKKNTAELFLYLFLIKNCNLLMSKLQKSSALKRESSTSKIKFITGNSSANPDSDTDPGTPLNPDPDKDPQLWYTIP